MCNTVYVTLIILLMFALCTNALNCPGEPPNQLCLRPKNEGRDDRGCQSRAGKMWYFDTNTNTCKTMLFKGCAGNENRFCTLSDCQNSCFYKHPERHSDLLHLLHQEIGDIAYKRNTSVNEPHCFQLSIDDIRKNDKYIIILYPVEELPYPENESKILCPTWKRFSTGYMNTSQALDYMRLLFSKKDTSPVQDEGWIFHAIKSMEQSLNTNKLQTAKERAAIINPKVTSWLKGPWSLTANIVAMDYFSNTNIIDVAIYANLHKAFNMANKNFVNFEIASN